MFENYLDCVNEASLTPKRKKALLLHALGTEGQRVFFTLPHVSAASLTTLPTATAFTSSATASTSSITSTTNVYQDAIATLEARYAATYNVITERRKFRQRYRLADGTNRCPGGGVSASLHAGAAADRSVWPGLRRDTRPDSAGSHEGALEAWKRRYVTKAKGHIHQERAKADAKACANVNNGRKVPSLAAMKCPISSTTESQNQPKRSTPLLRRLLRTSKLEQKLQKLAGSSKLAQAAQAGPDRAEPASRLSRLQDPQSLWRQTYRPALFVLALLTFVVEQRPN
ncbi:hypothetical protein HPB47_004205 [Ixodes persulcatus]|uniref:Uncharacterized protein n=1 Tax=Ixodes persulcatus TaxID=34615 RepID=A0AC60PGD3_IXOPE|nr:hypothetical protein HPB47_004205 [Ixodes persulcatus]